MNDKLSIVHTVPFGQGNLIVLYSKVGSENAYEYWDVEELKKRRKIFLKYKDCTKEIALENFKSIKNLARNLNVDIEKSAIENLKDFATLFVDYFDLGTVVLPTFRYGYLEDYGINLKENIPQIASGDLEFMVLDTYIGKPPDIWRISWNLSNMDYKKEHILRI